MWRLMKQSVCLLFFLIPICLFANQASQQYFEYLVQQKDELIQSIERLKDTLSQDNFDLDSGQLKSSYAQNKAKLDIVRLKIQSLQLQIDNQKNQQLLLSDKLKAFQKSSTHFLSNVQLENRVVILKEEYDLGKKNLNLLEENLALSNDFEALLEQIHIKLRQKIAEEVRNKQFDRLFEDKNSLYVVLNKLYETGKLLEKNKRKPTKSEPSVIDEKKSLLNTQAIDVIQLKLARIDLNKKWVEAAYLLQKDPNLSNLEAAREIYKSGIHALLQQEERLRKQQTYLLAEAEKFDTPSLKKAYDNLLEEIGLQILEVSFQQQVLQEDIENNEAILSKQLSIRTRFPDLHPTSWLNILISTSQIPYLFYQYVKNLSYKVYENMFWSDWQNNIMVFLSLIVVGSLGIVVRVFFLKKLNGILPTRLTGRVYHGLLVLIHHNIPYFLILLLLSLLFYQNGVSYSSYQLLFNLLGVFIFFRNIQLISRLVFVDGMSDEFGHDLKLYQRIRWLLIMGFISTTLMVFCHQFPLEEFMRTVFNRLFMLFLLIVSIATWRSREVISHLLEPFLMNQKRYVKSVVRLLTILIPITLFTTALIGLLGYNNLAWSLSQYQAQVLVLIAVYLLLRGVLIDALEIISEWMVESLYNGWLWIEVFLKPLDRVLRIVLFLGMLVVLINMLEEMTAFSVWSNLFLILHYQLISSPGIEVTIASLLEFLILFGLFFWLAKWTREFCYRWLYREARDVGIRNSLAVFTQYTVIIIGAFITLRVLGFDFAGLSLVLGGLAVGMGFGLRDFASNIVGGLMLLIERPVREGDLITLGDYEGRVAHIGIRSMRVCSWDNMEVLIPNAETFNKPFINWTHQDSIVRTVIPVKVHRADDPKRVQQIINEILNLTPEVLATPEPQVFLTEIDDALMMFEARYFINVNVHTRFAVRSKILFEMIERFKEAGIKPPIPPLQVELTDSLVGKE